MLPQPNPAMIFTKTLYFLNNTNFSFWKETDIPPNISYFLLCEWEKKSVDIQLLITLTFVLPYLASILPLSILF